MANLAIGGTVHSAVFSGVRQSVSSGGKEDAPTSREVVALAQNGTSSLQPGKTGGRDETPRAVDQMERSTSAFPSAEHLFESKGSQAVTPADDLGLEPLPPLPLMELARARYESLMESVSGDAPAPVVEGEAADTEAAEAPAANDDPVIKTDANGATDTVTEETAAPEVERSEPGAEAKADTPDGPPPPPPPDAETTRQPVNEGSPAPADAPPELEEKSAA